MSGVGGRVFLFQTTKVFGLFWSSTLKKTSIYFWMKVINSITLENPGLWPIMVFFMALAPWKKTAHKTKRRGKRW